MHVLQHYPSPDEHYPSPDEEISSPLELCMYTSSLHCSRHFVFWPSLHREALLILLQVCVENFAWCIDSCCMVHFVSVYLSVNIFFHSTFLVMGILWVLYSTSVSVLRVFALRLNNKNTIIGWFFKNDSNSSTMQDQLLMYVYIFPHTCVYNTVYIWDSQHVGIDPLHLLCINTLC